MRYKATGSDRRAFPRLPTDLPVKVTRPDSFSSEPLAATLQDISHTGALLTVEESIPVGEWIAIQPDQQGFVFNEEICAAIDAAVSLEDGRVRLVCRFPIPIDYSVLQLFL